MNGTLSPHLEERQEQANNQMEDIIDRLKATSEITEDMKNTDPLKLAGIMNTIKNQAEEIVVMNMLLK